MLDANARGFQAADSTDNSEYVGIDGRGGMRLGGKGTGVDASRRQEIRAFLAERFESSHDQDVKVRQERMGDARDDGGRDRRSSLPCWRCLK